FKMSESLASDISGDNLRILRQVKPEQGCYANHAVTVSNRLVARVVGWMNDQQPTAAPELFIQRANDGAVQRRDAIGLIPAICGDQYQRCAGRAGYGWIGVRTVCASAVECHGGIRQTVGSCRSVTRRSRS